MVKYIKRKFGYSDDEWRWILYDVANSVFVLTVMTTLFSLLLSEKLRGVVINIPGLIKDSDGSVLVGEKDGLTGNAVMYFTSYANLIYSLIIACFAPILGTMSDYLGFKKKFFVTFLLIGVLGSVGLIIGMNYIFLIGAFVVAMIGFAGTNIFYDAMLPDVTLEDRYHKISSNGFAWGYIGSVLPFIVFLVPFFLAYLKMTTAITPVQGMYIAIGLSTIWWVVFSMPLVTKVKCKNGIPKEKHFIRKSFSRTGATIKDMFKNNRNILLFLIAYSFYIDVVNSVITLAVALATSIGLSSTLSLVLIIVIQFVAFPFALIFGKLTQKVGAKKMIYFGLFMYAIVMVLIATLLRHYSWLIWVIGFLVATSMGGVQGVSRSMFGNLITDKSKAGEYFGFFNIFGKFATITGPLFIVLGIKYSGVFGWAAGATDSIFFLVPSMVIGSVCLIFVKEKKAV